MEQLRVGHTAPPAARALNLSPGRALALPLFFIAALLASASSAPVRQNPRLLWSFLGSGAILLAWSVALLVSARRHRRRFTLAIALRPQHYVQACAHASILLYWGYYWRPVYESAALFAAQLLFAYAFDLLLGWSRRGVHPLGFGPFPIVLSMNLFLWFTPDWFYLQFLMIAVGFAGKELIHWNKDGRDAHIFNPSSFALTIFSLALILTGTSDITSGADIAVTQFYPPHMYLFLFLISLPGQFLFGVATMTMSAVVTTYLFGLAYYGATGVYYFYDSYIPIAVFLGMHLLVTDPSTSPRTETGRLVFGALYGLGIVALYELLGAAGLPTFYDKLLPVPLLNLSVRWLDRAAREGPLRRFDPALLGRSLAPGGRRAAYIGVGAVVFAMLSAAEGVGDRHPGQWVPFWQQACRQGRAHACDYLAQLHRTYCRAGSGWSCNELGVLQAGGPRGRAAASASLQRGCELGFQPACANLTAQVGQGPLATGPPPLAELPILLRGSKGPLQERSAERLYARACAQGWPDSCGRAAAVGSE